MKTVLVTGATGFVGGHLARELLLDNYKVKALVRDRKKGELLIQKIKAELEEKNRGELLENLLLSIGDLTHQDGLDSAAEGVETIFHIGAVYREAKFPDEYYYNVNFDGTKRVLEAALKNGVKKFLHCSTTGVMGSITNPPADENHPYHPDDVYQKSKTEAEKLVLNYFSEGKIKGAIIRPTMIWGPGDTRFLKMFKALKRRRFPIIGDGKTLNHYVHVVDLCRGFILADKNDDPKANGEIYLIGGREIVTLEEACRKIADFYQVKLLPIKIPAFPVQLVGSIVEMLCRPFGIEPPIHRRRADFFVKSRAFSIDKAKSILG